MFHNIGFVSPKLGTLTFAAESQFGQNDTLARNTLTGTLRQSDLLAKDTLARDSFASVILAGDILASDTSARVTFWPEYISFFHLAPT